MPIIRRVIKLLSRKVPVLAFARKHGEKSHDTKKEVEMLRGYEVEKKKKVAGLKDISG